MAKHMTPKEKIAAARTALVFDQQFFGSLVLRLRVIEAPGSGTAWTDGRSIGYDPKFIEGLWHDEVVGVLAHEVLHCANGHVWRRSGRAHKRWNVACDYAINYILEASDFKLPKGRLRDAKFDGKSAEWIYDRVPNEPKDDGSGDGSAGDGSQLAPGAGGNDVRDAPNGGGTDGADGTDDGVVSEADWQQAVQQAAASAKMMGKLPSHLERFAQAAAQPRVNWRAVLRRFIQQAAKEDYSWRMPNTRHLSRGMYLPSLRSEAMGPIAVAIDTSGSIDDVTLAQFAGELNAIVGEARPARTHVIYCDAKVHRVDVFDPDDLIELKPVGGGGTDFRPALDAADALDDQPVCLIYLTDLCGTHRQAPPEMPILWATTSAGSTPYGEIVSLDR